jgi:hypothetical protein
MGTLGTWAIATNPFLAAIKGSYVNAKRISNFTLAKLNAASADLEIAAMRDIFSPFDTTINSAYAGFIAQGGIQTGASETFAQKLMEITANVDIWDALIKPIYAKTSGQYLALFPNGHSAFQSGSQLDKLTAIEALSIALNNAASLDTVNAAALTSVKTKVDAFYTGIKNAYDDKNEGKNVSSIQSDACFNASVAVCEQLFIILGKLIIKLYQTPNLIAGYFDEANIRGHQQTDFQHTLKHGTAFTIVKHTLQPTDQIRINNTGAVPIRFYASSVKDATIGTVFIEVAGGANTVYAASLLGDVANNPFIISLNPDAVQAGSFVLSLL